MSRQGLEPKKTASAHPGAALSPPLSSAPLGPTLQSRLRFPEGGAGACAVSALTPLLPPSPAVPSLPLPCPALPCQRRPGRRVAQSGAGQRSAMAAGLRFDGRVVLVTGAGGGEQRRPVPGCGVAGVSSPAGGGWVRGGASRGRPGEVDILQPPLPAALTGAPVPSGGSRGRL